MEEIDEGDMKLVNTFCRMDVIKEKTRALTLLASGFVKKEDFNYFLNLFDAWDLLAIDWVYSDVLEFAGSLPDAKAKEIEAEIGRRQ